jgi:hypothetical protein
MEPPERYRTGNWDGEPFERGVHTPMRRSAYPTEASFRRERENRMPPRHETRFRDHRAEIERERDLPTNYAPRLISHRPENETFAPMPAGYAPRTEPYHHSTEVERPRERPNTGDHFYEHMPTHHYRDEPESSPHWLQ